LEQRDVARHPGLHHSLQREQDRAVGLLAGEPLEELVALLLAMGRHVLLGGKERHRGLRVRVGGGSGKALQLAILRQRRRPRRNSRAANGNERQHP